jgi:hypothetical protein
MICSKMPVLQPVAVKVHVRATLSRILLYSRCMPCGMLQTNFESSTQLFYSSQVQCATAVSMVHAQVCSMLMFG